MESAMHRNIGEGLYANVPPQDLPKTECINLTEALTWLAFGDSFTDERFEANSQKKLSVYWDADDGDPMEAAVNSVLAILCDLAKASKIELLGSQVLKNGQQEPCKPIPPEVFASPITWWPGFFGKNGFHESGVPHQEFVDVDMKRKDVFRIKNKLRSAPTGAVKGKRPQYRWDQFEQQLRDYLAENGLPSPDDDGQWRTQADVVKKMTDWCERNWTKTPADSTIRNYVRLICSDFLNAGNSDFC